MQYAFLPAHGLLALALLTPPALFSTPALAGDTGGISLAALRPEAEACLTLQDGHQIRLPARGGQDVLIADATLITRARIRFNAGCPVSTGDIRFNARRLCPGDAVTVNGESCEIQALDRR